MIDDSTKFIDLGRVRGYAEVVGIDGISYPRQYAVKKLSMGITAMCSA